MIPVPGHSPGPRRFETWSRPGPSGRERGRPCSSVQVNSSSITFETNRDVQIGRRAGKSGCSASTNGSGESNHQDPTPSWGHAAAASYGGGVYRRVLDPWRRPLPVLRGAPRRSTAWRACFLEYGEGAIHPEDSATLPATARWLRPVPPRAAHRSCRELDAAFLHPVRTATISRMVRRTRKVRANPSARTAPGGLCIQRFAEIGPPACLTQPTVSTASATEESVDPGLDGRVYGNRPGDVVRSPPARSTPRRCSPKGV